MPDARPANGSFWDGIATLNDWPVARAAYAYAVSGLAVFPVWWVAAEPGHDGLVCQCNSKAECSEPGKHPLVPWKDGATRDPEQVQGWWQRWPQANIGVALGRCDPPLVVLDLDQREVEDGIVLDGADVLEQWREDNDLASLLAGTRAGTGGGGSHLFYLDPQDEAGPIRNTVGWLPQVDVKAAGGYVLLAPSLHVSGGNYQWVTRDGVQEGTGGAPVPVPPELARALRTGQPGSTSRHGSGGHPDYDYQAAKENGPQAGQRDDFFFRYASQLRGDGVGRTEAERLLRACWSKAEQPAGREFSWETAKRKLDNAWVNFEPDEDKRSENAPILQNWVAGQRPTLAVVGGGAVREIAPDPVQQPDEVLVRVADARPHGQELLLSEHSAALVYVKLNSGLHKYTPGKRGIWHAWDGNIWAVDAEGAQAHSIGMDRVRAWFAEEGLRRVGTLDERQQRAWVRFQERLTQAAGARAVVSLAKDRSEMRVETPDLWDPNPDLLVVANGTVNLRTGEFGPSLPEHLGTRCCGVAWPEAGLSTPDPKRWVDQLRWMTGRAGGDPDESEYLKLWYWCGYGTTGHVRENKALVMVGKGRNGKSIFTETLAAVLGTYAMMGDVRVFAGDDSQHSTEVAALEGARFIYGAEVPAKGINVERFKMLTGEARVSARQMQENSRTFRMQGKFFMHGNSLPAVSASAVQSDGYWRRLAPLMCERQVTEEEKDDTLKAQFWDEREAILTWLVRGAMAWFEHGLPETWRGRLELAKYREDENPAAALAQLYFQPVTDTEERIWVPLSVLREMNDEYCRENGERPYSAAVLKKNLIALGFGRDSDEGNPRPVKFNGSEKVKSARGLSCPPFLDESWKVWYQA